MAGRFPDDQRQLLVHLTTCGTGYLAPALVTGIRLNMDAGRYCAVSFSMFGIDRRCNGKATSISLALDPIVLNTPANEMVDVGWKTLILGLVGMQDKRGPPLRVPYPYLGTSSGTDSRAPASPKPHLMYRNSNQICSLSTFLSLTYNKPVIYLESRFGCSQPSSPLSLCIWFSMLVLVAARCSVAGRGEHGSPAHNPGVIQGHTTDTWCPLHVQLVSNRVTRSSPPGLPSPKLY